MIIGAMCSQQQVAGDESEGARSKEQDKQTIGALKCGQDAARLLLLPLLLILKSFFFFFHYFYYHY